MKKDQIKKNIGYLVRLRPMARSYEGGIGIGKELEPADHDWRIKNTNEKGIEVENLYTGHCTILGYDHIREFLTDPSRGFDGTKHGFLHLKVQIRMSGIHLQVEPILG